MYNCGEAGKKAQQLRNLCDASAAISEIRWGFYSLAAALLGANRDSALSAR